MRGSRKSENKFWGTGTELVRIEVFCTLVAGAEKGVAKYMM